MKFISVEGRIYSVDIRPSKWPRRGVEDCKSNFQFHIGQLVDELYPTEVVLEEFYVPGEKLYIDFFIPRKRIAVEVMGEQHYAYSRFFHGTQDNFKRSQERDNRKSLWCTANNITLIRIRTDDSEEDCRNKLLCDK